MKRYDLGKIAIKTEPFPGLARKLHLAFLALFVLAVLFSVAKLMGLVTIPPPARWPDGLLLVLTAATTLAGLCRSLPGQNVMLASVIIAIASSFLICLGVRTGIPFGPFVFQNNIGQKLFEPLPWAIPVLWLVILLNARGVARLILKPWRKTRNYGFWLLGVSSALCVLFDLGLEPLAAARGYWSWYPTKLPFTYYGAPLTNFAAWAMASLLILTFTTPSLINKKPVKAPADFHPIILWSTLNALIVVGLIANHLVVGALIVGIASTVVAIWAIRSATW